MAVQFRTSHVVEYVHTGDPATVLPDPVPAVWPSPDPDWLPADGQPAAATRFGVRPLSHDELTGAYGAGSQFYRLCYAGVVSVDGGAPAPFEALAAGWDRTIANLVIAITTLPMTGPASRSKGGPSQGSTDGGSSGAPTTAAPP